MNDLSPSLALQTTNAPLSLTLLGPPQLAQAGEAIPLARRQMRALLYRLAAAPQATPRDQLCFLFWPDIAETAARRNLTVLLNQLRQALPLPDVVQTRGDLVLLNPTHLQTDAVTFADALALAARGGQRQSLAYAVDLYKGPFLDGFSLPSSPEFDTWLTQERQSWERRYLDALALLVDWYANRGDYAEAITMAQRALAMDHLAEEMHRQLILLYGAAGDRRAAIRQFEHCVVALERELGVSPLPETRAVYDAVRQGGVPGAAPQPHKNVPQVARTPVFIAADTPTTATTDNDDSPPASHDHLSLPATSTPLIDRHAELAAIRAHLCASTVRLLTLTGPGGSGKTQLALQAAWEIAAQFTAGAVFVALAPLRDPELVLHTIGQVCGLKQTSADTLADYLSDKELLLVLDNCEHLLAAGPAIAALLAAAPRLRILATSRAALNLQGEYLLPVPPLPLPDLTDLPPLEKLAAVPSVALLLERTQALNSNFRLTPDNAAEVAAICVRLDGLPLALELAAARLKLLAPRDLARRLDKRLSVLTHGARDLPERQQTLRATIDWSYRLLNVEEQIWFERCSTFVGGWTLAAMEGLAQQLHGRNQGDEAGMPASNDDGATLLDVLAALTNNNLVQATDDEGPRFTMLETIREFAAAQLTERGARNAVAQAHADYYLALVEPWDFNAPAWLTNMERELDNLRASLRWYLGCGDRVQSALRLGTRLARFWYWRDWITEGRWWLEQMLAYSKEIRSEGRADIQSWTALFATVQGDILHATALYEANLQLCQELHLLRPRANALVALGTIAARQGNGVRAVTCFEESLAVARELNNPNALSNACYMLANTLAREEINLPRAIALYEECLTISRTHGLAVVESMTLAGLGLSLIFSSDCVRAAELLSTALQMQRAMNATMAIGWTYQYLGILAYLQGDDGRAGSYFVKSLEETQQGGGQFIVPFSLEGMAGILSRRQQTPCAARLLGAAEALREAINLHRPPLEYNLYRPILASVQAHLPADTLCIAWQEGRQLTVNQAITEATVSLQGRR